MVMWQCANCLNYNIKNHLKCSTCGLRAPMWSSTQAKKTPSSSHWSSSHSRFPPKKRARVTKSATDPTQSRTNNFTSTSNSNLNPSQNDNDNDDDTNNSNKNVNLYPIECKLGCGRGIAPGSTRHGNPFQTCCRSCATSNATAHGPGCDSRFNQLKQEREKAKEKEKETEKENNKNEKNKNKKQKQSEIFCVSTSGQSGRNENDNSVNMESPIVKKHRRKKIGGWDDINLLLNDLFNESIVPVIKNSLKEILIFDIIDVIIDYCQAPLILSRHYMTIYQSGWPLRYTSSRYGQSLLNSKIGGLCALRSDSYWPRCNKCEKLLSFLIQINMTDLFYNTSNEAQEFIEKTLLNQILNKSWKMKYFNKNLMKHNGNINNNLLFLQIFQCENNRCSGRSDNDFVKHVQWQVIDRKVKNDHNNRNNNNNSNNSNSISNSNSSGSGSGSGSGSSISIIDDDGEFEIESSEFYWEMERSLIRDGCSRNLRSELYLRFDFFDFGFEYPGLEVINKMIEPFDLNNKSLKNDNIEKYFNKYESWLDDMDVSIDMVPDYASKYIVHDCDKLGGFAFDDQIELDKMNCSDDLYCKQCCSDINNVEGYTLDSQGVPAMGPFVLFLQFRDTFYGIFYYVLVCSRHPSNVILKTSGKVKQIASV